MSVAPENYNSRREEYRKEREFLETLMNSRFNFLLLAYGVVVAGAIAATSIKVAYFVLVVGLVICGALALATYRAYTVVLPIIQLLKSDASSPLSWASSEADKKHRLSVTANRVIGSLVPKFCVATLLLAVLALYFGCWSPTTR